MYTAKEIAEEIEKLLKTKSITIKQMLEDCNLGRNLLSNMKVGKMPSADKLAIISKYLNVSGDSLLGLTDDPTPPNKKDPPDEFRESRLLRDKLIEMGVLKEDEYLNKAQINALFEIFKGNGDYIRFIIDKYK